MTFLNIIINIGADPSGTHLKSQYSEGWGGEIPRCRSDNTRPHLKKKIIIIPRVIKSMRQIPLLPLLSTSMTKLYQANYFHTAICS